MTAGRPSKRTRSDFGERLVQARKKLGMTQVEAAQRLNVPQGIYAYWERRTQSFTIEQLKKISEVLEVTSDYLLGKERKKLPSKKKT